MRNAALIATALVVALGVLSAELSGTVSARAGANPTNPNSLEVDNYQPSDMDGITMGDDNLASEFGTIHYSVANCQSQDATDVTVSINRFDGGVGLDRGITEIVRRALLLAKERCPQQWKLRTLVINLDGEREFFFADVRRSTDAFQPWLGPQLRWSGMEVHTVENWFGHLLHAIWVGLQYLAAAWAAWFFYKRRDPIARWYYFTFHPHPAEPAITSALARGTVLDGRALASILGESPSNNRILRSVRAAQAQTLIAKMEAMTRAQIRDLEQRTKEGYELAAAQELQAALAQAAIALEQAKSMLHASMRSHAHGL